MASSTFRPLFIPRRSASAACTPALLDIWRLPSSITSANITVHLYSRSNQDITNQAVLEVSDRLLYDIENNRAPYRHGPLDPRLGTSSKSGTCSTCQEALQNCTGHFGQVRLPLPAFHVGYLRFIITILQNICKVCFPFLPSPIPSHGLLLIYDPCFLGLRPSSPTRA